MNAGAHPGGYSGQDAHTGLLLPVSHKLRANHGEWKGDGADNLIAFPAHMSGTQCASAVGIAPVLQAGNPTAIAFDLDQGGIAVRWGVRRLTPTEYERLMGFPDGWTLGFSDARRYHMLGNAAPVPVTEWIARRLRIFAEREGVCR